MVTECPKRAEGTLGKESRGNGSVGGEPVHRSETETV